MMFKLHIATSSFSRICTISVLTTACALPADWLLYNPSLPPVLVPDSEYVAALYLQAKLRVSENGPAQRLSC